MKHNLLSAAVLCIPDLILLCVATGLSGQDPNQSVLNSNPEPPGEKIYLHIDRPDYMQGDTIWFKAYSWYGYEQEPDTMSRVLYVDLINSDGRVESTKKLSLEYGTAWGEFILNKNVKTGQYNLRAYTRWIQYTNNGNPFYNTVTVNPIRQDLLIDYNPVIIKQEEAGTDSLQIKLTISEMGQTGELIKTNSHSVDWSVTVGNRLQRAGNFLVKNSVEAGFKIDMAGVNTNDTLAILGLSIHAGDSIINKEFNIPLLDRIDLQFFPEGGKLVAGLESRIAFKAIGTDGISREVKGEIVEDSGEVITNFESIHKGMGSFLLKPESGKKYYAVLMYNDRMFRIPLPVASDEGYVILVSCDEFGNNLSLSLKLTPSEVNRKKYFAINSYGKLRFSASTIISANSTRINIPLDNYPEGVTRLTILNENFEPECERLFYINKDQRFNIEIRTDTSYYSTRSKVTLFLKTTDRIDGMPLQTELSLAVEDKEQISNTDVVAGISSYKLLQSELKGNIENPGYYFSNDNINYKALDLLMLTQGYRTFNPPPAVTDLNLLQPERNYWISGKLEMPGKKWDAKEFEYEQIEMLLMFKSDKTGLFQFKPDSLGNFSYSSPIPYGKADALVQATYPKGKPFKGFILLNDSIEPVKFPESLPELNRPSTPAIEYMQQLQVFMKTEMSKDIIQGAKTINLPEIVVTARSKNWFLDFKSEASKIAELDSIDPTGNGFESLNELLIKEFGAKEHNFYANNNYIKTVWFPCTSVYLNDFYPIYVINGTAWLNGSEDYYSFYAMLDLITAFNVNEIKKLYVLPPGEISDYYSYIEYKGVLRQSLVVIETYPNWSYRGDPVGIKRFIMNGLDAPRQFYSPKYEGSLKNKPVYDGRATLYWEPCIITDRNGEARVEFYTSDRETELEVIVNGIDISTGIPGESMQQIVVGAENKLAGNQ